MNQFILASKNKGKLKELSKMLEGFSSKIISMEEAGILEDIQETGTTFDENSMIKARSVFEKTGGIVIADDSGLEIDALGGKPGVFSARFAGENASDFDRIRKVLQLMEGIPQEQRQARFICSITVMIDEKNFFQTKGVCEGKISTKAVGRNGFGYDPIFYLPEFHQTMAEIPPEKKQQISHRGKALESMILEFRRMFQID